MLSIPKASDLCTGSTDLNVAMTFGIADMKVKKTLTKVVTMNQDMYEHEGSQGPVIN